MRGGLLALLALGARGGALQDEVVLAQLRQPGSLALAAGREDANHTGRFKYGFYLHVCREAAASVRLLRSLRQHYRDEPVYIMSDGGKNYSGICAEIGHCTFRWKPPAHDRWNPVPFLNRFREAAKWLQTEYIVMLEPDNEVRWKISVDPQDDAGGMDDKNPPFKKRLVDYLTAQGRSKSGNPDFELRWPHFGLCGGSYFRTEAVLRAFDPASVDWEMLVNLDSGRIWSSDIAMALAMAVHGYTTYPWIEVTQTRYGLNNAAAIRHYGSDEGKPEYGRSLTGKDAELVTEADVHATPVTCKGCVWVSDEVCWNNVPLGCPTKQADHMPGHLDSTVEATTPPPAVKE